MEKIIKFCKHTENHVFSLKKWKTWFKLLARLYAINIGAMIYLLTVTKTTTEITIGAALLLLMVIAFLFLLRYLSSLKKDINRCLTEALSVLQEEEKKLKLLNWDLTFLNEKKALFEKQLKES